MTRKIAHLALYGILLVLALRMTMTETAHQLLSQIANQIVPPSDNNAQALLPEIGPAVITGLAAITFFLAAVGAWCAASARAMTRGKLGQVAIVFVALALGLASAFLAANKFIALVGLCDIGMAMMGGWTITVLCQDKMLGDTGRRIVIAAIVSILCAWVAKGIYQRTIDIPETIKYYNEHKEESLAQALGPTHSMRAGDPEVKLFESRMLSKELTGFVTLSNVMGAGMVGLVAILAGLVASRRVDPIVDEEQNDLSVPRLLLVVSIIVGVLGVVVLFLTASRGASVIGVGVLAAIAVGAFYWRRIVAYRRVVVAFIAAVMILFATSVIAFGITHDRLPSKSLMFRWHYWTGSAQLIKQSPALGVGLNNFGDYYTSVKRSSSPEDVKDPHSFFVRLASEAGLPATIFVASLIVWMAFGATRGAAGNGDEPELAPPRSTIVAGAVFCAVWWLLHQLLAEPADQYYFILSILCAAISAGGWALASGLLRLVSARGIRFIAVAALLGALGMLLYDQINMALVTGPVAMFFWMLLAFADSYNAPFAAPSAVEKVIARGASAGCALAAVVVAAAVWWPTLNATMPWDPSPQEIAYLRATMTPKQGGPDFSAAKTPLVAAIALAPRSMELRQQLFFLKTRLHEPVADDIRAMIALDHANARPRMNLALVDSDLPTPERVALLEQALRFDSQFDADEVMRLSDGDRAAIRAKIDALRGSPATSP